MALDDPSTAEEWLAVARERGLDAAELLLNRAESIGPSYLAGYVLESALKAYLQHTGEERPGQGPEGHNLRALWKACQRTLGDLKDESGASGFFFDDWDVALRYQARRPSSSLSSHQLVDFARRFIGVIQSRIRNRPRGQARAGRRSR